MELDRYLNEKGMPLMNKTKYNNTLEWWKQHEVEFPVFSKLAIMFLAIMATSAPSVTIWSRAVQILTAKRSRLEEDVSAGIIFVKENISPLKRHYDNITKDVKDFPKYDWFKFDVLQDTRLDVG